MTTKYNTTLSKATTYELIDERGALVAVYDKRSEAVTAAKMSSVSGLKRTVRVDKVCGLKRTVRVV
jgi:hypothetical protein